MIKIFILAVLVYFAYRLFTGQPLIGERRQRQIHDQEADDDGFTDYEELD